MLQKYAPAKGDGVVFRPAGVRALRASSRAARLHAGGGVPSPPRAPSSHARGARPAGATITNVKLSHVSVCQALANCVTFEGPGTLANVEARVNFVLLPAVKKGVAPLGSTSALLVRGASPPTLKNARATFQVTEPNDQPAFSVVRNTCTKPVVGLSVDVEGWCGGFAAPSIPGLPAGQAATGGGCGWGRAGEGRAAAVWAGRLGAQAAEQCGRRAVWGLSCCASSRPTTQQPVVYTNAPTLLFPPPRPLCRPQLDAALAHAGRAAQLGGPLHGRHQRRLPRHHWPQRRQL